MSPSNSEVAQAGLVPGAILELRPIWSIRYGRSGDEPGDRHQVHAGGRRTVIAVHFNRTVCKDGRISDGYCRIELDVGSTHVDDILNWPTDIRVV